jgi:phosphate transport system permease protein
MSAHTGRLADSQQFHDHLRVRNRRARAWGFFFFMTNAIALIALVALFLNIGNSAFGLVAVQYDIAPASLSERPIEELNEAELMQIVAERVPNRLRVMVRDALSTVPAAEFTTTPLGDALGRSTIDPAIAGSTINEVSEAQMVALLSANLDRDQVYELLVKDVLKPNIVASWNLFDSWFDRASIEAEAAAEHPDAVLESYSWVSARFIREPVSSSATTAGLRTALLGSLWIIGITVLVAFPLGVGAAIYLEEYATGGWISRLIETNIRNLAGVPSIIYGMLGLAVFVRALGGFTSGAIFGVTDSNGRTVLSAALTMALLILPVIIINAQEALRAVPTSIREASFGVGATKWQTVRLQVLPAAMPGILTGVILSMSRAVGETAPLIVVGASTFIGIDPNGPFSKFTAVPIQIWQWTARPELEFKNAAAAAIIVLLGLLLILNATAIILRQRLSKRLQA